MNKFREIPGGVCAPQGFKAAGVHCGLAKSKDKKDLALIYSQTPCAAAGMYTTNKVKAAPLLVTHNHLADGKARAVLCNSGNANACNADGEEVAIGMCRAAAKALGVEPGEVIVASTGVIGQPLPLILVEEAMQKLSGSLSADGSSAAAHAIMTTDLAKKEIAVELELDGKPCRIGGIAKGSGMIHPNMATMLAFVTTDAAISPEMLDKALKKVVPDTFNMVSVDGDTSTNDMVTVLANGLCGNGEITEETPDYKAFRQGLQQVCVYLAKMMAKDGEGATKLLECQVTGAPTKEVARSAAKSVICSSLFKSAMFGADANWGRILCALGYAPGDFRLDKVDVAFQSDGGKVEVCRDGAGIPFSEDEAKLVLSRDEIQILVNLRQGSHAATAWGCDLTYDYVKINGDYRS